MLHEGLAKIEQVSELPVGQAQTGDTLLLMRVVEPFDTRELACHRFSLGVLGVLARAEKIRPGKTAEPSVATVINWP